MFPLGNEPSPYAIDGSPEHAAAITDRRRPEVRDRMQWLAYTHLPEELRKFSAPFYLAAQSLLGEIGKDNDELVIALDCLIAAKDAGMRSGIRSITGRAGSVPRPQEVVDPPKFGESTTIPLKPPPYFPPGAR